MTATFFPSLLSLRIARTACAMRATETVPALPEAHDADRARRDMLLDLFSAHPEAFSSGEALVGAVLHFSGRS